MRDVILKRFNYFDPQHVELITDEPGSLKMPTRANIMAGLAKMVKAAKEGDVLLFHFSGHGVEAYMKPGRKDDAIVPCDLNLIYDVVNNIGHLLTGIFRDNVSLKFRPSQEPRSLTEDEGILLSGCQADELSLDLEPSDKTQGKACGAFTYSLQKIINETNGTLTKKQLVMNVRDEITSFGFHEQHPCLYCSDKTAGTAFLATIPTPLALPMIKELVHNKKAVLVGCNYPKTPYNLKMMFNFDRRFIKVLTDNYIPGSWAMPTGITIKAALYEMVRTARPGDVLFFYFSGHGTAVPILKSGQPLRLDEAILPCDFNLITDVDFGDLVNQLPEKVNFRILSDSCHSCGLIDKERTNRSQHFTEGRKSPECITRAAKQKGLLDLQPHEDKGILVSGCEAYETSFDVVLDGNFYGAFNDAVVKVFMGGDAKISNKDLVTKARDILKQNGSDQTPCLYCSNADLHADFLGEVA
ncbi:hypothetical protein PVK06_021551 [Gossypium arboreum]|uniref:Peptidase C14 caspase domain-containing protein n=1 Tax=Gossypium arboreum TaxID=29729 RepID=A0ABR0PQB0_GOSAR|nr:hypothetical protein PVK06_021551 [Gossypium arboreum]